MKLGTVHETSRGLDIFRERLGALHYQIRIRDAGGALIRKQTLIGYNAAEARRRSRAMARAASGAGGAA